MNKYVYALMPLLLLSIVSLGCLGQQEQTTPEEPPAIEEQEGVGAVEEEVVEETPTIELTNYPTDMNAGESAQFEWGISGVEGTVSHTAVHFGKQSTPVVGEETNPADTNYELMTQEYSSGNYAVPGEFSANIVIDEPGTYYARAHTVVDGKNVWSDEVSFTVQGEQGQPVKEFTVKVSDAGFEPSELEVNKGDLVRIRFEVASEGTHANGVRIVSPMWQDAPALMPGDTQDVEFTATESFDFRLFWMAGNLLKGKATVVVNE